MHGLPKFHVSCRASFSLTRVSLSLHGHSLSETGCSDAVTFNNSLGYLAQNASHWDSHTATWQYKPIPRVDVREYARHTLSDVVCHMTVNKNRMIFIPHSLPDSVCIDLLRFLDDISIRTWNIGDLGIWYMQLISYFMHTLEELNDEWNSLQQAGTLAHIYSQAQCTQVQP